MYFILNLEIDTFYLHIAKYIFVILHIYKIAKRKNQTFISGLYKK